MENKRTKQQVHLHHSIMECGAKYNIPLMWRKGHENMVLGIPHWETVGYSKPERNARELVNKVPKDLVWHVFVVDLLRILGPVPIWG